MVKHVRDIPVNPGSDQPSAPGSPSPSSASAKAVPELSSLPTIDDGWRPEDTASADLLDNFWTHMDGMFPNRWSSQNGSVPRGASARAWLAILRQLSSREIKAGLRHCLTSTESWPPTPGQFRQTAIDSDRPEHRALPRSRRLDVQAAEDSVRESHMAQLKSMVGLAPKEGS